MKKITSIIGVLIMWHMVGLLQSCDPCGSDGPIVYNLESISSELIRIIEKEISPQTTHSINLRINEFEPFDVEQGFIRFDSIGINILTEIYELSHYNDFNGGSIFSSALACSPSVKYGIISDISITSSEDYEQFQAGELLNEIILIRTEHDTFGTLLSEFQSEVDYSLERHNNMLMTFSLAPFISKTHNLTIVITTGNGDVFTEEIKGLKISN